MTYYQRQWATGIIARYARYVQTDARYVYGHLSSALYSVYPCGPKLYDRRLLDTADPGGLLLHLVSETERLLNRLQAGQPSDVERAVGTVSYFEQVTTDYLRTLELYACTFG